MDQNHCMVNSQKVAFLTAQGRDFVEHAYLWDEPMAIQYIRDHLDQLKDWMVDNGLMEEDDDLTEENDDDVI